MAAHGGESPEGLPELSNGYCHPGRAGGLPNVITNQRAIGNRAGEGATLNNLSTLYHARGDYDTALRYLEESLAIRRAIGDRAGLCATLFNIGHIHLWKDEHQQALACWIEAYRIAKEIGYAEVLAALENLAKQLGGNGLELWERLPQQMESKDKPRGTPR